MKKLLLFATILVSIILFFMFYRNDEPVEIIREVRDDIVEDIKVIDQLETAEGIMIYSVGESNNGENYMYSVDLVKNSLTGYKWLGGGGHVNTDVPLNKQFTLS
ncbi:hypothetical protein [Litchfieldia alkalitelluris]|uniref:hypothetical protein n=1 Tax=Litchfieldia alkalitelluris TaxID=304268 RepID=UPI00099702C9|nr:hypothetical protein [Litchfieldia alkalitelluris]